MSHTTPIVSELADNAAKTKIKILEKMLPTGKYYTRMYKEITLVNGNLHSINGKPARIYHIKSVGDVREWFCQGTCVCYKYPKMFGDKLIYNYLL